MKVALVSMVLLIGLAAVAAIAGCQTTQPQAVRISSRLPDAEVDELAANAVDTGGVRLRGRTYGQAFGTTRCTIYGEIEPPQAEAIPLRTNWEVIVTCTDYQNRGESRTRNWNYVRTGGNTYRTSANNAGKWAVTIPVAEKTEIRVLVTGGWAYYDGMVEWELEEYAVNNNARVPLPTVYMNRR